MRKRILVIILCLSFTVLRGGQHVQAKPIISVKRYMANGFVATGFWLVYGAVEITNDPYLDGDIYGEVWFTDSKGHNRKNTIKRYYTTIRDNGYADNLDTMSWRIFKSKQFHIDSFWDSHNCDQKAYGNIMYQGFK